MSAPLIAIVGDTNPQRQFDPPMNDPVAAKRAAEEIGAELATRRARLLVYGGPFLEADVVRGFVRGKPHADRSIIMWYTTDNAPPPFPEEQEQPNLFERRAERGADWEIAFYRSVSKADGIVLIGGGNATLICGQVAIGIRLPLLALADFGGAAKRVWNTLSAGEDLPTREEITLMASPWSSGSPAACVAALFAQRERRRFTASAPPPSLTILAAVLFLAALGIVPWAWGKNAFDAWMLFLAPLLAGGAGAAIRPLVDRLRGSSSAGTAAMATVVLGLVAGGISGILFVTAQLTGNPELNDPSAIATYARHAIPYAVGVGFVAGLTADAVFGRLLGLDVVNTSGIEGGSKRA
jgi:hypothetical protein